MADGHGGYRRPSNPAPVSGPGAHSRRTDGGPSKMDLPNARYGEAQNFDQIQSGAPLGGSPSPVGATATPQPRPMPVGMNEPSQMPGQPVTAGANAGLGPDMASLGLGGSDFSEDVRQRLAPLLPWLIQKADDPRASQALRDQVRYLIANL